MRITQGQFDLLYKLVNYYLINVSIGFHSQSYSNVFEGNDFIIYSDEQNYILHVNQMDGNFLEEQDWEKECFQSKQLLCQVKDLLEREEIVLPATQKYKNYRFSLFLNDKMVDVFESFGNGGRRYVTDVNNVPGDLHQHITNLVS